MLNRRRFMLASILLVGLVASARAVSVPDSTATAAAPDSVHAGTGWSTEHFAPVEAPSETALAKARVRPVPVFLGGRELFRVRAGRDGMTIPERAALIRRRLTEAVEDLEVPADSVELVPAVNGIEVRLGSEHLMFVIIPADLPGPDQTANLTWLGDLARRVKEGVRRERAENRPVSRLITVGIALGITLAFGLVFAWVRRGGRRWRAWLARTVAPRLPGLRVANLELVSRAQFGGLLVGTLGRIDLVLMVALGYTWLTIVFSRFPWTQSWSWELRQFAFTRTVEILRALLGALPGLATVVVILWLFRLVIRAVEHFFTRVETGQVTLEGFHPELAPPSRRLASMLLWIAAVLVAYPYIPGAESKSVQGISVLLGVMVSLGSSGVVGNFIAGLVLTYSRSFSLGDRVRIGEHVGDVIALGTFATKLRSLRNEEITLPNGSILSGTILNYTRRTTEGGLWLHTQVTIGYDVEWRQVHALLIEAALAVPGVEREPVPIVYQRALNDFHVSYEITCLTHDSHAQLRLYSDLHAAIQDAFARAGVEILSPAFANLRDANAPVLPREPQGPRDEPGGFRLRGPRPGA